MIKRNTAEKRIYANVKKIRGLLTELDLLVGHYEVDAPDMDWGDVGDLARMRSHLNEALYYEDEDPE